MESIITDTARHVSKLSDLKPIERQIRITCAKYIKTYTTTHDITPPYSKDLIEKLVGDCCSRILAEGLD